MKLEEIFESMDSSYPHTMMSSGRYEVHKVFVDDLGIPGVNHVEYDVHVMIEDDVPDVGFGLSVGARNQLQVNGVNPGGVTDITGIFAEMGKSPMKLLSTVAKIIRESSLIRRSGGFEISAKAGQGNRGRVYETMLRKARLKYTVETGEEMVRFVVSM